MAKVSKAPTTFSLSCGLNRSKSEVRQICESLKEEGGELLANRHGQGSKASEKEYAEKLQAYCHLVVCHSGICIEDCPSRFEADLDLLRDQLYQLSPTSASTSLFMSELLPSFREFQSRHSVVESSWWSELRRLVRYWIAFTRAVGGPKTDACACASAERIARAITDMKRFARSIPERQAIMEVANWWQVAAAKATKCKLAGCRWTRRPTKKV